MEAKIIVEKNPKLAPLFLSLANIFERINMSRITRSTHRTTKFRTIHHMNELELDCDLNKVIFTILNLNLHLPQPKIIYAELYLKCRIKSHGDVESDRFRLLLERWTLMQTANCDKKNNWNRMIMFLEGYLRNGEVSQFIDQNSLTDSSLFLLFEPTFASQFINQVKWLDFPIYSSDGGSLSIRVEWLPLRLNMSTLGDSFYYYESNSKKDSKNFQIVLPEQSVVLKRCFEDSPQSGRFKSMLGDQLSNIIHIERSEVYPDVTRISMDTDQCSKRSVFNSGSPPLDKHEDQSQSSKSISLAEKFNSTSLTGPRRLVGSFVENLLMGSQYPVGYLDTFSLRLSCIGNDFDSALTFPLTAFFFDSFVDSPNLCPYLGYTDLRHLDPGYRIAPTGLIQIILFNPNKMVIKIFLIDYNFCEMPPNSCTFIRQKITYAPTQATLCDISDFPIYLQYCVHLRVLSTQTNEKYLYSEIRIIFPSHPLELESDKVKYELVTNTEIPSNPPYCLN